MGLLGIVVKGRHRGRGAAAAAALRCARRESAAAKRREDDSKTQCQEDHEVRPGFPRRKQCEGNHGMEPVESTLLPMEEEARRHGRRRSTDDHRMEEGDLKAMKRLLEKQKQSWTKQEKIQLVKHQEFAKKQIIEAESSKELMATLQAVVEEDWLGHCEELQGNIYSIAAFGVINVPMSKWCSTSSLSLDGIKARARLLGCIIIALVQVVGPPCVLVTSLGFEVDSGHKFLWEKWTRDNIFADWHVNGPAKLLGTLLLFAFVLNGLFVVVQCKQTWFKLYNTFRYLKRSTPNFVIQGSFFLYLGAFVDCWTVLWCSISCYVVVGTCDTVQDVLFDSLSLLFLYNLDDVGGGLGFISEQDWPGLRLGWMFQEMVKPNWQVRDEDPTEEVAAKVAVPCKKNCGRMAKPGFTTCCRACALDQAPPHDDDCAGKEEHHGFHEEASDADGEEHLRHADSHIDIYSGGETWDWSPGGFVCRFVFSLTVFLTSAMAFILPLLQIVTPFSELMHNDL